MTFLSELSDAAGDAVTGAVDAVGIALGHRIETIGNGLAAWLVRTLPSWFGDVISAIFQFVAIASAATLNLAGNLLAGLLRILLGGLLGWDRRVLLKGLANIGEAAPGALLATIGSFAALVQTVLLLQPGGRPLNGSERSVLQKVYRRSVRLDDVRIVEGFAGLFSLNSRPFTLGNRIYMKAVDTEERMDVLVHECGHVWQYRHEGARYIGGALLAQWTKKDAYDWSAEQRAGKAWPDFNREAQAEFIQDVFRYGRRSPGTEAAGTFFDEEPLGLGLCFSPPGSGDLTDFARDSVAFVRSR